MSSKILLSGGCVLTLGARTPNLAQADVLIDGSVIAEVAPGLRARDAERVDATDTIVMPGFVDTHRHIWTSLFRNLGDRGALGEGAPPAAVADLYRADDAYAATLIGLLGAIEAGITSVVDWSHVRPDDGLPEAALQAHADAGLRTVFVMGGRDGATGDQGAGGPLTRQLVERLRDATGPSTTIAFGQALGASADLEEASAAWALARELGMRIHAHADPSRSARGTIVAAAARGLLAEDVTLVHPPALDDADHDAIASSGASVALTPSGEMSAGLGSPQIQELVGRDIRPGLGVDDERLAPGDLFAQMRATIAMQHATVFDRKLAGKAGLPRLMSTRDVIRFATVDGARAAGLGRVTGSLEPGMQADVIVLRTDRPNIFPINDPVGAVVWGMDTSNVDRVIVGGRVLMRDGVLEADVQRARRLATDARARVAAASGPVAAAAQGGAA